MMGWSITIGQKSEDEDGFPTVEVLLLSAAPLNSADNNSNHIKPGYTYWGEFLEHIGMIDLQEEGAIPITPEIVDRLKKIKKRLNTIDAIRLEWLTWWTEWALNNCSQPIICMR